MTLLMTQDDLSWIDLKIKLFAAIAVGLAADSIEQFVIGFILPSTQQDLCLNEQRSAWLGESKLGVIRLILSLSELNFCSKFPGP